MNNFTGGEQAFGTTYYVGMSEKRYDETVGGRIHWARKNKGLTLGDVAGRMGIRSSHLSGVESNKVNLSLPKLAALLDILVARAWRYAGYGETTVTHKKGRTYVKALGKWPAIIDAATAERSLGERAARKANRRIGDARARLTGVVWCARCQQPMNQSLPAIERDGRPRHVRFYCKNPRHANAVPTARIEAALRLALDDLAAADLTALAAAPNAALESIRARMAEHEAAIKRQQARLEHAVSLAVDNLLPADTLRGQLERINAAIAAEQSALDRLAGQLDAEQSRGTQRDRLVQIVASGYAMLTTTDTALANIWWRQFVRVWCDDNQVIEVRLG